MKFLTTVELNTSGECVVEAPSRDAAEAWMAAEKSDRFRNWYLDDNLSDYTTHVSPTDFGPVDIYLDEAGKEISR